LAWETPFSRISRNAAGTSTLGTSNLDKSNFGSSKGELVETGDTVDFANLGLPTVVGLRSQGVLYRAGNQ